MPPAYTYAVPECIISGCANPPVSSRGWCGRHLSRWRKYGDPEYPVQSRATVWEEKKTPSARLPARENMQEGSRNVQVTDLQDQL
jgi:hypothetical protein